jgi:hypothetical protein
MAAERRDCFEAIEATLKRAAEALHRRRFPFLLGGSLAVWARGGPESCNDLDLMIRRDDADAALVALEEAGMRAERPPEGWLLKAWDGAVLVDLIFDPKGLPIDDATFERAEPVSVFGLEIQAMTLDDVLITKLRALQEHNLDYDPLLQMTRAVRESVDWARVRSETSGSPYAAAFFTLAEGVVSRIARWRRALQPDGGAEDSGGEDSRGGHLHPARRQPGLVPGLQPRPGPGGARHCRHRTRCTHEVEDTSGYAGRSAAGGGS